MSKLLKEGKNMPFSSQSYILNSISKSDIRKELLHLFSEEAPGSGTGELCSKYYYYVETYDDHESSYKIVLKRPAPLNKGLDFTVNIEGMYFKKNRRYSNPGHSDIVSALMFVKSEQSAERYGKVAAALKCIYDCTEYNLSSVSDIYFLNYDGQKHPIAIILLAAKWLFIEQDMTYWNWSGRDMLMNHLRNAGLV